VTALHVLKHTISKKRDGIPNYVSGWKIKVKRNLNTHHFFILSYIF